MPEFRLIHTSDLHLGRRFSNFPEEIRGRLVETRHSAIAKLADVARAHNAEHILVAGDLFDTETPSEPVWRQAVAAMGKDVNIHWWIIPGNHDSLAAESLWNRFRVQAPETVHLIDAGEPIEIAGEVSLLPAPLPRRFPGKDLTDWMRECPTPDANIRIGLAHGGVVSFGSEDDGQEIIPLDRSSTAGLDYLALGDWHGVKKIGERTYYSGTPERDRFKHAGRGCCLAVTISGPRAVPEVQVVETGRFDWAETEIHLTPEQDPGTALQAVMPGSAGDRRDILMKLNASGWTRLPEREALSRAIEHVRHEFGYFEYVETALQTEIETDDLDEIAQGGALRLAADALYADAENEMALAGERAIAAAALRRLYGFARRQEQ
ncbi:metallophosphoesterase family protein [Oricola indica]|uniref:metallophosphoesterase family protein n=1 Tax=Oricola indica TaxID=2872591 RepID=UPI003CCC35ED